MNPPVSSSPVRRPRAKARSAVAALAAGALVSAQLVLPAAAASAAPTTEDYTQFVNPFIATEDDFGQDGPGAFTPHGLAKVTPLTSPRSHVGYDYNSTQMAGFTGITLDGVGGNGAGGDFLVVPTYQNYTSRPSTGSYLKGYSHANESASPGHYRIDNLTEGTRTIDAQVTADTRTGVHEYAFDQAGKGSLVVDLRNNFGNRNGATLKVGTTTDGNTSLSGRLDGFFYNANYQLYYYAETTRPASTINTWNENDLSISARSQNGTDIGAVLTFNVAAGSKVGMRVTFSPISVAQAKRDMAAEVGGKSFEDVRAAATDAWNAALGAVEIEEGADDDPTGDLKIQLYTHLFRMNGSPINATSTDGTYRGVDGVIYRADGYTHYDSWALWDDFRKYSSIAMIYPDVYGDIAQSLVDLFAELANSGKTSLNQLTHSVPTVRWERAAVVIADAISKGAHLDGLDLAYPALVTHSNGQYNSTNEALGYIPSRVAETVGTSYDDWGMAVIADALGKTADANSFRARSTNYVNLFNKDALTSNAPAVTAGVSDVGLIVPRNGSGAFVSADPERFEVSGAGLYQGTLWQYHWYTAQDMGGIIELMGGREAAKRALSFHFGEQEPDNCRRMLHSNANEIDLQAPYLFNYVGAASHTQYWARQILTEESCNRYIATGSSSEVPSGNGEYNNPAKVYVYKNHPQGFLPTMDNDAGTMSAVFVAGALGLFPVTSGADSFQIGSPIFEKATIHYPSGKSFVIEADGVNADNFYIQDASLNGAPLNRTWLTFDELTAGGVARFTMGDEASTWGDDSPMAYSLSDEVDSRTYHPAQPVSTSRKVFTEAAANDGSVDDTITLTADGTTFAGADGADVSAHVQVAGLPAGLSVRATKTSGTTLTLALEGKASSHAVADSTDNLVVTLAEAAFVADVPAAQDRALGLKVSFQGYGAQLSSTTVTADTDGAIDSTIAVELTGGAIFAGADGSTLTSSAVQLAGLASGVSASVFKTSDTSVDISLTGTLDEVTSSTFVLVFQDEAFVGGVTAALVTGAGLSGISPVTISVRSDLRGELAELVDEAKLVVPGNYSAAGIAALRSAIDGAESLLGDPAASDAALRQGVAVLQGALDGLVIADGGYRRLEAEANDVWSGGELKTEGGGTGINVGGVERDSWLGFLGLDFSEAPLKSFVVNYAHNPGSASASSTMEIRTGSADGTLVTTIALPTTGGWGNYVGKTHEFTSEELASLDGRNDVFFVFRAGDDTSRRWVANLDFFEFVPVVDEDEPTFEFAELGPNNVTDMHPGMGRDGSAGAYTNFGNTHNEEWIHFADVDFGPNGADTLKFSYSKPAGRSTANTWIDVRLGSPSGPSAASSVMLPATDPGTNWGNYVQWETTVDPGVFTGTQDVYIVFRMDLAHTSDAPYVGNFRWFRFDDTTAVGDTTRHTVEFESIRAGNGTLASAGLVSGEDFSGNDLKTEGGNGGGVLAGTFNGNWVRYQDVDLGDNFANRLLVTYAAPDHRVNEASLAVYVGSRDGDPLVVADLPNTEVEATNWNTFGTISVDLPTELTGVNTLYLEFRSVPVPGKNNVGNFDSFALLYGIDKSALRDAISELGELVADKSLYVASDFKVFERALEDARALAADADATAGQVAASLRQLTLAAGQLEWKVVRQLNNWIATLEAIDADTVHPAVYAKIAAVLAAAKALDPASASHAQFVTALAGLTTEYQRMDLYVVTETSFLGVPATAVDRDKVQVVVGVSNGATGDVELSVDGKVVAKRALDNQARVTFTVDPLAKGAHNLTATYLGEDLFLPSSTSPVTITVITSPVDPGPKPEPEPVSVSVPVLSKSKHAYSSIAKLRASVSVTVSGATSGKVTFASGKTTLGSAQVRKVGKEYKATLRIRGLLPRGSYRAITATLRTSDKKTVSSVASGATFTVVKAALKTAKPKVSAKPFRARTRPVIVVRVSKLTNGKHAVGQFRIRVGGKTVTMAKLRAKDKGKVTVRLPRTYSKKITVQARFLPKNPKVTANSTWSKKVRVQVRR